MITGRYIIGRQQMNIISEIVEAASGQRTDVLRRENETGPPRGGPARPALEIAGLEDGSRSIADPEHTTRGCETSVNGMPGDGD